MMLGRSFSFPLHPLCNGKDKVIIKINWVNIKYLEHSLAHSVCSSSYYDFITFWVWAAVTRYHGWGDLNNNHFLLTVLKTGQSEIRVPAWSLLGQGLSCSLQLAAFLLCPQILVVREREKRNHMHTHTSSLVTYKGTLANTGALLSGCPPDVITCQRPQFLLPSR